MTTLTVQEEFAEQLAQIAQRQQRSVDDLLAEMLARYVNSSLEPPVYDDDALELSDKSPKKPIEEYIGIFDDEITDLSTTTRETMKAYYREKYGDSD
jgi:hypothetical protein